MLITLKLIVLGLMTLGTTTAIAEIYQWTDTEGNIHFTDKHAASSNAARVQLQSPTNRYHANSVKKFAHTPGKPKKSHVKDHTLPKLRPKQVILYSAVWCSFCKKAKAYFKQKGIAYSERDIEKSKQAEKEYRSLGGGGIPLILVGRQNGTEKLSGFSIARFDHAYR